MRNLNGAALPWPLTVKVPDFIIKRTSSDKKLSFLLDRVSTINKRKGYAVQLLDPNAVKSRMHLAASYVNAVTAINNGTNNSRSVSMEFLLYVSFTRQIGEAISLAGAKTNNDFVIFSNSVRAYNMISPYLAKNQKTGRINVFSTKKRPSIQSDTAVMQAITISGLKQANS